MWVDYAKYRWVRFGRWEMTNQGKDGRVTVDLNKVVREMAHRGFGWETRYDVNTDKFWARFYPRGYFDNTEWTASDDFVEAVMGAAADVEMRRIRERMGE